MSGRSARSDDRRGSALERCPASSVVDLRDLLPPIAQAVHGELGRSPRSIQLQRFRFFVNGCQTANPFTPVMSKVGKWVRNHLLDGFARPVESGEWREDITNSPR